MTTRYSTKINLLIAEIADIENDLVYALSDLHEDSYEYCICKDRLSDIRDLLGDLETARDTAETLNI